MKIEHFALNVEDPLGMADWYVTNLGMNIVKKKQEAPFMHFLGDDSGQVMIEIYRNPADKIPDYADMDPLLIHLAFVSEKPDEDKERLTKAGASVISDEKFEDGTHLVMMRDPWGLALQLCKRGTPMLKE